MDTKELANVVVPKIESEFDKIVSQAVSLVGGKVSGRDGKHLAKVLGFQLVASLRNQGVTLDDSSQGVTRGAYLAKDRLTAGESIDE